MGGTDSPAVCPYNRLSRRLTCSLLVLVLISGRVGVVALNLRTSKTISQLCPSTPRFRPPPPPTNPLSYPHPPSLSRVLTDHEDAIRHDRFPIVL